MNFKKISISGFILLNLYSLTGCSGPSKQENSTQDPVAKESHSSPIIQLTAEEKAEGWELLFDGENLNPWRSVKSDSFPSHAWVIEDGTLVLAGKGGDIITKEKYKDFELTWEFNLTEGANSGIKYFVDSIIHKKTGETVINGPEYQIIDDLNYEEIKDDPNGLSSTGSLYLLYAPENKILNPAGEWNQARIIAKNGQIEHWLNGKKVVGYEKGSDDFLRKMAETKFADYPEYGQVPEGHILLTDHQDRVFFRNIRIRRL